MAFLKRNLETYCSFVRNNKHMVNNVPSKEFTKISKRLSKQAKNIHYGFGVCFVLKGKQAAT